MTDDAGALAGATVVIDVLRNGNLLEKFSGTTGSDGSAGFRITNAPSGYYSTVVLDAFKDGWEWDESTPDNGFTK